MDRSHGIDFKKAGFLDHFPVFQDFLEQGAAVLFDLPVGFTLFVLFHKYMRAEAVHAVHDQAEAIVVIDLAVVGNITRGKLKWFIDAEFDVRV